MAIGAAVRSLFGPWEATITDVYRSFFVDLTRQIVQVRRWVPNAEKILEVGCGEGAVCERLAVAYPHASITGIDISPRVGRLFRGDRRRVRFECTTASDFAAKSAQHFDLILLCDVLHHVPWHQHQALLTTLLTMLMPGGAIAVKDWVQIPNMAHLLCEFSDRVLTGDDVKFGTVSEFRHLLQSAFGAGCITAESCIRPWRNNWLWLVRPTKDLP